MIVVCCLSLPAQSLGAAPMLAPNNGAIARQHLEALSDGIGARVAGTPEETAAAQYIEAAFKKLDYPTEVQTFSFGQDDNGKSTEESANVIAVKTGLSPRVIVVGAHYDSVDTSKGADDNASGVAVLLEVAEKVKAVETPYTIRFVAFGAEEVDLDGSRYYVDELSDEDIKNTVGMINLDGLIAGDMAYVYGDKQGVISDWILQMAESNHFELHPIPEGYTLDYPDGTPCECADYGPFEEAGIPFAYFEATNWNLGEKNGSTQVNTRYGEDGVIRHTEYDNIKYLDETFPGRIDQYLDEFVTLVYNTLTTFKFPG